MSIPLYARENSIVAVGAREDNAVYDYARDVVFRVYSLGDGREAGTEVYSAQGGRDALIRVEHRGNVYRVDMTGAKPCQVELHNVLEAGCAPKVSGVGHEVRGRDVILAFREGGSAEVVL